MNPPDLRYSKEHEWVRLQDGVAIVGITDFAQEELGDVVFVQLPDPGSVVSQFQVMGVVESVKAASDLFSPISGDVVTVNGKLEDMPELVNTDPYGDGWMIEVRLSNQRELDNLMSVVEYERSLPSH